MLTRLFYCVLLLGLAAAGAPAANVELDPRTTRAGYVAALLINEVPFPGDPLYRSEEDTKRGMLEILWVLDNRVRHIPPGYTQERVAHTRARDIIDVITAPGQVEGFHRDSAGQFTAEWRVFERLDALVRIANEGTPGRFARLLNHAQELVHDYYRQTWPAEDLFAPLRRVGPYAVTGRSYAWMTADLPYRPGGDFVAVPRYLGGAPGGNRIYTLRKLSP
jgi:hypothetical protein